MIAVLYPRLTLYNTVLNDKIEYNILDLTKLPVESDATPLWDWMNFLKVEKVEELESMKPNCPEIQKAIEELRKICENSVDREKFAMHERALRDYISIMTSKFEDGYEEGLEKGLEEGRTLAEKEAVKKFLEAGFSPENIAEVLGVSLLDLQQ